MKKSYYKIELRMGEENSEGLKDYFYYSDGYIIIEGGLFEGIATLDFIRGAFTEEKIYIQLFEYGKQNNYEEFFDYHYNAITEIFFVEEIKDISKIKNIDEQLQEVKNIHSIS